ncbi:hypothetical protein Enr13x_34540 [Stieleria neptunia]|uniref:WD domain, G-beta repeat n=1 Tax=Stieleria neptunia TaxID=2527979 RepID=A0A518HRY1_9BACT|nr:WD40 repeat domain-containing protein [Stieleria neptunia]QDV43597.1 hypothetical protein Enr13x_34540 [Stieleria neptunia]
MIALSSHRDTCDPNGGSCIDVWDNLSGDLLRSLERPGETIHAFAYDASTDTLLVASGPMRAATRRASTRGAAPVPVPDKPVPVPDKPVPAAHDVIRRIDLESGEVLATLSGVSVPIAKLACSQDGTTLVAIDSNSKAYVWDLQTNAKQKEFPLSLRRPIGSLHLSHTGGHLMIASPSRLSIYDTATGKKKPLQVNGRDIQMRFADNKTDVVGSWIPNGAENDGAVRVFVNQSLESILADGLRKPTREEPDAEYILPAGDRNLAVKSPFHSARILDGLSSRLALHPRFDRKGSMVLAPTDKACLLRWDLSTPPADENHFRLPPPNVVPPK